MDGTPNEAVHITEIVDLIIQYKNHSERSSFHVMSIGQTPVILGHMWVMEHNPDIDWLIGGIIMTRCPASCGLNTPADNLNNSSAGNSKGILEGKSHHWVHIEEVLEMRSTQTGSLRLNHIPVSPLQIQTR